MMVTGNLRVSESPDVLEALRFIPKGCQTVAGGRSVAETTGMVRSARSHPGGMPETRECFPQIY